MTKIFEYIVNAKPEIVWEKTLLFWNQRKGRVRYHTRDNMFFIDKGMSMSGCRTCSYGEKYEMKFFNVKDEPEKTIVKVSVRLKLGTGTQWKIASDTLRNWALVVGTTPQEFGQIWAIVTKMIAWGIIIALVIVFIIFSLSY